jgi:hypothetical protein
MRLVMRSALSAVVLGLSVAVSAAAQQAVTLPTTEYPGLVLLG